MLDDETCYRALLARDRRFDGVFFVGVTTTGIYCRPICPARTPRLERCAFFRHAAEAEQQGYRACLRCRPELAPGLARVDALPRLTAAAIARIEDGALESGSIEDLAAGLGVTARHLRRAMRQQIGVGPLELLQSRRLAFAKQLLHDSELTITAVAHAAGFRSLRRFHAAWSARFGCAPSAVRRHRARGEVGTVSLQARESLRRAETRDARDPSRRAVGAVLEAPGKHRSARAKRLGSSFAERTAAIGLRAAEPAVSLRLDHRPPLAWEPLLEFLRTRAIPGVEAVTAESYRRTVSLRGRHGWLEVRRADATSLRATVSLSLVPVLAAVASRLRTLFDLDAQPAVIDAHLARDPDLAPAVRACPGVRVPGTFDGGETAVRVVLGQQVSVVAATTLSGRVVAALGEPLTTPFEDLHHTWPTPAAIAGYGGARLAALGMPQSRGATVAAVAALSAEGVLEPGVDPEVAIARLRALPGVGPWTTEEIALRVLRCPDAFPASDLALRRALGNPPAAAVVERGEAWRPWRAYAVVHWTAGGAMPATARAATSPRRKPTPRARNEEGVHP